MREKNIRQNLNSLLNRISPKWDTFSNINKNINDINKNSSYWFTGIITVNCKFRHLYKVQFFKKFIWYYPTELGKFSLTMKNIKGRLLGGAAK